MLLIILTITHSYNVGKVIIQVFLHRVKWFRKYSPVFTLLRWRHDFLPRFLFIETTETEKNKKNTRLFIDGHFEVILCSCQFDNFSFLSLITLITNITFRSNCQQIWNIIVIYDQLKFVSDLSSNIREVTR
jgi:hypothetical protein